MEREVKNLKNLSIEEIEKKIKETIEKAIKLGGLGWTLKRIKPGILPR